MIIQIHLSDSASTNALPLSMRNPCKTCDYVVMQACRVPSSMWSKLGRLKRSVMPKLTKGSTIFGSGASPGIMSCIAGRLLCDTFLCSRDLLKEV